MQLSRIGGDVDLIAPVGFVDAGDAGIRVSGNFNVAALQVLNAANIEVQGTSTGVPVAAAPNIAALTAASKAAGAAEATTEATKRSRNRSPVQDLPSIFTVEVIGYGDDGGRSNNGAPQKEQPRRKSGQQSSYDPNGIVRVVGNGELTDEQKKDLTEDREARARAAMSARVGIHYDGARNGWPMP